MSQKLTNTVLELVAVTIEQRNEIKELECKLAEAHAKNKELLRDVNGCWVVSNNMRPTQDGIYTTIDSHGIEGETLMDTGHWVIRPDRHPVHLWFKPNCR